MATLDEKIKAQEENLKKLKVQKQRLEAKVRSEETENNRKNVERKKYLIGALVLDEIKRGKVKEDFYLERLNEYLLRDSDRALFRLSPLKMQSEAPMN